MNVLTHDEMVTLIGMACSGITLTKLHTSMTPEQQDRFVKAMRGASGFLHDNEHVFNEAATEAVLRGLEKLVARLHGVV